MKQLENQLRQTRAIGLMSKLALKNQVDDLVGRFKDFHDGRSHTSLAELREPFNRLMMKALALTQDSDPALASSLQASRESLWTLLADENQFRTRVLVSGDWNGSWRIGPVPMKRSRFAQLSLNGGTTS